MKNLILVTVLFLAACAMPEKPGQAVWLTESHYAAGLRMEIAYSKLPDCAKPKAPPLCSDANVVRKVQEADDIAWEAIQEAQIAVRTPGFDDSAATAAVASATALTNTFVKIAEKLKIK